MKFPNSILSGKLPIATISDHTAIDLSYGGKLIAADGYSSPDGYIMISLPADLPQGFSFEVMRVSVGAVYFVDDGTSTIYNTYTSITNQFDTIKVTSGIAISNEWVLEGNLEAAPTPGGGGSLPAELTYYWSIESVSTTGSSVDSWIEQKTAIGDDWSQTGANRPTIASLGGPGGTVDAIAFNGTDQYFPRFALSSAITQPCFITICMDELTGGGAEGCIYDDNPSTSQFFLRMNFGSINAYTGGGASFNVISSASLPASWYVLTIHFDGTSTASIVDGGSWSAAFTDGGANGIAGLSIGARSDNTVPGAMRVTDFGIGEGSQTNAETVHNYVRTLRGL